MSRPVADLKEALAGRAAAAGKPVAAATGIALAIPAIGRLPGELDAELLEPVDRGGRLAGEDLDEPRVRRLV